MEAFYDSIVAFYLALLVPPIVTGPLPAAALVAAVKRRDPERLRVTGLAIAGVDFVMFLFMTLALGEFIGPGSLACMLMPFSALTTAAVLLVWRRKLGPELEQDLLGQRWLVVGTLLIPMAQLVIIFLVALLGPLFCELGWRTCSDW